MTSNEQRLAARQAVRLRVDVKPLSHGDVKDILEGQGYGELSYASLSLAKPRSGMLPARIRDLSMTGARVEGLLDLGLGEAAAIDLHFPDDRVVLKALAEVVWSKPAAGPEEPHACGLRFAALEEDSLHRLENYLRLVPQFA